MNTQSSDLLIFDRHLRAEKTYWMDTLSVEAGRATLPLSQRVQQNRLPNWQTDTFVLPETLYRKIQKLANGSPLLIYTILLTAVKICLYKYNDDERIMIGSPSQRRTDTTQSANTLVILDTIKKDLSFSQLLVNERKTLVDAYQRQRYPFPSVLSDLGLDSDAYPCPLFAVAVVLEAFHDPLPAHRNEVTLSFSAQDLIMKAMIDFDGNIYHKEIIARFADHLLTLLASALDHPHLTVDELDILSTIERHTLLFEWNRTQKAHLQASAIHHLIEAQAKRIPDVIALVYEDHAISYAELDQRANQLATHLREAGVGSEVTVGLCVERSLEMIVGLLGILKAGGAYVPIDPSSPHNHACFIAEDAHVRVVVTQAQFRERFSTLSLPLICFPLTSAPVINSVKAAISVSQSNLAYVIYTSGSSGRPKGVAIEHGQIISYLHSILDRFASDKREIVNFASVSTIAADLGNTSLFAALCTGRCLHIISEQRAIEPEAFSEYMHHHAIDCLKIVPLHLETLLLSSHPAEALPELWLILGGDVLPQALAQKLQQLKPACTVMNHYGPTETTVGVLTFSVDEDETADRTGENVPLGRPLANTDIYILDTTMHPVPVGVPGELYIGGESVGRGYFKQPGLTAERFVPHPFSLVAGARLYKSGDRGFYQPDGTIQFAGRVDNQIKIRGYRIEPGEIESHLRLHPAVRDVAVCIRREDRTSLVAYVVPEQHAAPTVSGKPRYLLPNNLAVMHLNKNETDYLYEEIFEKIAYIKHGIHVHPGDCVFDVGANIGLFTLFINQLCSDVHIYAFEPVPEVFTLLNQNAMLYNIQGHVFNVGIADETKVVPFTYFPGFSILSGLAADPAREKGFVKMYMQNQRQQGTEAMEQLLQYADPLLENRLKSEQRNVQLKTLSQVIAENKVERIDLLKINVEKSELAVLQGITPEDWAKIHQIVLEVDSQENLHAIVALLQKQEYQVNIEQDTLLRNTERYYLYALREREARMPQRTSYQPAPLQPVLTTHMLRSFLSERLPTYMLPAHFVLLEALPLTANGKIDRRKLEQTKIANREHVSILPRTPTEEVLLGIWSGLFQVEQLSIEDNFFEQGGHSLLAAQLAYRVRDAFKVDITVGDVFDHPSIAELAELISKASVVEPRTQPLQPRSPQVRVPLAFGQQRLWFLNQLAPNSSFYSTHAAIHLRGPLYIEMLKQSLKEVLRRHEVLRTTFPLQGERPIQMITPSQPVTLPLIDLCTLSAAQSAETLQSLLDSEGRRSFDLAQGPLVRGYLIQLDHQEHVLLMSVHHTIFDAWSRSIFLKEIEAFYTAFVAGDSPANPPLPTLRVQYADFTLWQQSRLQHGGQESLDYWKQKLANIPMLELPTDRPRPALQTFRGASALFSLSPTLTAALTKLSRQEGASLFMTLMAAFQTLLYRYTGQNDISVSTGASNRTHADLEKLIGFFVNTLVLRCNLSGNPTFREVLRRVRRTALEAYEHQDVPFDLVIEQVRPERDLSYNPLFQVALILQNVPRPIPHMPDIEIEFLKMGHASSKVDLTLNIQERSGGLTGSLEYNTDLFDPSTIERMLHHFRRLLECVIVDPTQMIAFLPILTPEEQQQFLIAQNFPQAKEAPHAFFHRNFEAQVARVPEAVALQCAEQQVSYLELNRRANMLAQYLQAQGLCREGVVGVFSEHTLDTIIALLAVWKAGGTYLPLDPTYPSERLALLIADAGVHMVISPSASSKQRARDTGAQVFVLQEIWKQMIGYCDQNLDVELMPDNLAYIIYTSGSTGQPKGVMLCHQGLSNVITAQIEGWRVQAHSRVLQFASLSFDASLSEIGMALLMGATLYLREDDIWLIGTDLAQLLYSEDITHVTLPPSILATLPEQPLPALATLIVAGEECPPLLAARWAAGRHLFNGYGPTEVTIGACYAEYTSTGDRLPICGKRFPHMQLFILDTYLQLVPSGVIGELYIAGPGLARGYHNMPELTSERFIPHPFSQIPGDRLYKTSDLARYRSDGNIEYIGRSDQQIKIRGFRIEPGEIEVVLTQHPAVRNAVVIAYEDTREKKRLVAYVVLDQAQNVLLYEVQDFLKQHLPVYMLPTVLLPVAEFPLTVNGKIDYKALPDPDSFRDSEERAFVAPRTEIEQSLALIWSEVLNVEQVGIYDDFFEMGGDSLLSLEVLTYVKEVFGINISIQQVFKGTTVVEMARVIAELQS